MTKIPIPATKRVALYWGNQHYGILIGTCQMNDSMRVAREWFEENSHYFHTENFPPYQRIWGDEDLMKMDYGSHNHYVYIIPT